MATSIIPKSEIRQITGISVGYGEVPAIAIGGIEGWALPGNIFTLDRHVAMEMAARLDRTIRKRKEHLK